MKQDRTVLFRGFIHRGERRKAKYRRLTASEWYLWKIMEK